MTGDEFLPGITNAMEAMSLGMRKLTDSMRRFSVAAAPIAREMIRERRRRASVAVVADWRKMEPAACVDASLRVDRASSVPAPGSLN